MLKWIKSKIQGFSSSKSLISTVLTHTYINIEIAKRNIEQVYLGYFNLLKYGSSGIQSIISFRRSWIIGSETTISSNNADTKKFIEDFNHYNQYQILTSKLATYGEIEGRVLIYLLVEKDKEGNVQIVPRVLPFNKYSYIIERDEDDRVTSVYYMALNEKQYLPEDRIIYVNLSIINNHNNYDLSMPNVSYVMDDIKMVDMLLEYWNKVNDRFSKTTPIFETDEWSDAVRIAQILRGKAATVNDPTDIDNGKKWAIGDGLAVKGKATTLEFNMDGIESLKEEITSRVRKISAHTGVPVHMLGFPDLLSNRATAQEMAETIAVKTRTERLIWETKLKEVYEKSIKLYNKVTGSAIDPSDIRVTIPVSSQSEVRSLMEFGEKMLSLGIISKRTYRDLIPNIDHDLEEQRLAEERKATANEMRSMMGDTGSILDEFNQE